jgi:TatA/E family protein of Tat protein translocase
MRIGPWEIVVVLVVALVLFGPNRLPDMGKAMGKAIREFRKATADLGKELEQAREELERPVELGDRGEQREDQAKRQDVPERPE